jgi:hypothetical protein
MGMWRILIIYIIFPAGDFVKFGFPMAYTITVLSWGVVDHEKGYINASSYKTIILDANHLLMCIRVHWVSTFTCLYV